MIESSSCQKSNPFHPFHALSWPCTYLSDFQSEAAEHGTVKQSFHSFANNQTATALHDYDHFSSSNILIATSLVTIPHSFSDRVATDRVRAASPEEIP